MDHNFQEPQVGWLDIGVATFLSTSLLLHYFPNHIRYDLDIMVKKIDSFMQNILEIS